MGDRERTKINMKWVRFYNVANFFRTFFPSVIGGSSLPFCCSTVQFLRQPPSGGAQADDCQSFLFQYPLHVQLAWKRL